MERKLEIITRGEAHILERPRFYDGRHCKHDHLSERYTSNGICCECARLNARRYAANRTKAEKEIEQIKKQEYWLANRKEINERRRRKYASKRERKE